MAEEDLVKRIREEVKKKVKKNELLCGPGSARVRKAQAFLRKTVDGSDFIGSLKGAVRLRKLVGQNEEGNEKITYEPVIIQTAAHLRSPDDNYLVVSPREKMQEEINALAAKIAKSKEENKDSLDLEGRLQLNRVVRKLEKVQTELTKKSSVNTDTDATVEENPPLDLLSERVTRMTEAMLANQAPQVSALQTARRKIGQTAIHDFPSYVFLRKPGHVMFQGEDDIGIAAEMEAFLQEARQIIKEVVETCGLLDLDYLPEKYVHLFPELEELLYRLFVKYPATALYELQRKIQEGNGYEVLHAFREWLIVVVSKAFYAGDTVVQSCDNPELWKAAAKQIAEVLTDLYPNVKISNYINAEDTAYSFIPFDTSIVNFGLRLVYRQEWRTLGTQPGEIVRTIPLGPKQTEKISTKVLVNEKIVQTAETFTSLESDSESSNTTKDSTDIVKESANKFGFKTGTEGGGSWGAFSAKASMELSAETASSSKDTKSHLNESMVKTASKIRNESKVVVSVEKSSSEEYSSCSEIVNPNEEIAVTYVYSRLQRQYEIFTRLAEVNSVIFIPERVPAFSEINAEWLQRHAAIIAKALLDQSFVNDLALLVSEVEEAELDPGEQQFYLKAAEEAKDNLGKYTGLQGSLPDIFIGPQEAYQKQMDKNRVIQAKNKQYNKRKERLIEHIRRNILHYMRAIWEAEDTDQRMMRYAHIYAPTLWVPEYTQDELEGAESGWFRCEYFPDLSEESMKPLTEIINPAGPLGYVGNYAVYNMRSDHDLSVLNHALATLRACYVRFAAVVTPADEIIEAFVLEPKGDKLCYALKYNAAQSPRTKAYWSAVEKGTGNQAAMKVDSGAKTIEFDGVLVRFTTWPKPGKEYEVTIYNTGELQDPELLQIRRQYPLPPKEAEQEFFSLEVLQDMAYHLPDIEVLLLEEKTDDWVMLSPQAQERIKKSYHQYLLKREYTRQFVLEINNLLLDMDIGKTPILEDFKRLQRAIDVMKELEEYNRRKVENERRILRLQNNQLSDPDIETMTIQQKEV